MGTTAGKEIHFGVNEKAGAVSGLLLKPGTAAALLLLAHGAGAGMRHRFMEQAAVKLAEADLPGTRLDLGSAMPTATDPTELVERVNRLVFGGTAKPETLRVVAERIQGLTSPEDQRTVALALALGSPEFQYQ